MKTLRILLLIAIMVISASTALAVTVTLQGSASGTYTLQSMTIDSNGNITLSVSSSTPPPPGALTLSLNPTSLPSGTVGQSYNQSVTMTATGGTSPYTYTCSGSGVSGISASASGNTCTIKGTPATSGNYTVSFNVTDSANGTASQSLVFSVNANTPPRGDCIDITAYKYPKYSPDLSIPPQTAVNYCFTIDSDATKIQITMSSRDWWTSSHVLMSDIRNQTKDEIVSIIESRSIYNVYPNPAPWYSFAAGSNERVYIQNYPGKTGQRFYVTVYNLESTASSLIQLNWIAY